MERMNRMDDGPPGPLAYLNGRFLPARELSLPVHDAGFVFGATVTDLCRTFRHQLFRLDDHLTRFHRSCHLARIHQPKARDELTAIAQQLVSHNSALLQPEQDLALVLFATPGPIGYYLGEPGGPGDGPPTLGMHTFPLPFARYRRLFREGARLVVLPMHTAVNPSIKHRSRLHWWIADRVVQQIEPGASALLADADYHVTETAAANVLFVRDGTVLTPPRTTVLNGVSLRVVEELCGRLGITFAEQELTHADCARDEEAMLSCTSFCLAGVRSITGVALPWPGPIFQKLLHAWSQEVGVDIAAQILADG